MAHPPSQSHSIVAALAHSELATFFPGHLGEELIRITGPAGLFDPTAPESNWMEFLEIHRPAVAVTHWSTPPLPEVALSHLRYVAHATGSVRKLVPRHFLEKGVRVTNWGDGAAETVAESALLLTLAALRETQHWGREMHERAGWRRDFGNGRTLFDRTVAIHGFGRIARALLPLLKPFRVSLLVFSEGVPPDFIRQHGAEPAASLEELFNSSADVLIELEALTPRSSGSVREEHLRARPPGSVFVNCGRGAVVDESALIQVAADGNLHLALDVFASEPLPADSPLRGQKNVTLTPHVSGPTPDRFPQCGQMVLSNLQSWRDGKPLMSELNLQAYDLST